MGIKRLEVQSDHLQRLVKSPAVGVEELIWNAIDADADIIRCVLNKSEAGGLESLVISDNGTGFNEERAEISFGRLGGSWKATADKSEGGRALHGKAGQGRLSAFGIGDVVRWNTTSESIEGAIKTHQITGRRGTIQEMEIKSIEPAGESRGTVVEIGQLNNSAIKWLESSKPVNRLTSTFALTLEKYNVSLYWDATKLDPKVIEQDRWSTVLDVESIDPNKGPVELEIIEWKVPEGRQLILCDQDGIPLAEMNAGIRAPGFNFTAYVRWAGFLEHSPNLTLGDLAPEDVQAVIRAAKDGMRSYFADRVNSRGTELIKKWKDEKVYPYSKKAATPIEKAERELFEIVAVTAAEAFKDSDTTSRRLSLRLIKEALENNPSGLQDVLSEVIGMNQNDLDDLASLLKQTSLSSMIRSTRDITDRLKFISGLEEIIYGDDYRKTILERTQLHRILAAETWIFREEYQLTADDDTLTTALEKYQHLLAGDDSELVPGEGGEVRDYTGGVPVVDLMLTRVVEQKENQRHHIVIEIKRPTVHIGHSQIGQIERYAAAVVEDGRFDLSSTSWEFWIVGDKIANAARMKTANAGIIQAPSPGFPVTIRAVSWSQIIQDARHRLKFVKEGLGYGPSTEEAMGHLKEKHGKYLPGMTDDEAEADGEVEEGVMPEDVVKDGDSDDQLTKHEGAPEHQPA